MELKPGAKVKITYENGKGILATFKGWRRDPVAMIFAVGKQSLTILKAEVNAGWVTIETV